MSIQQVKSPYNIFTDSDGTPLESGYIYIGEQNKNAKTYPVSVYWDENLTIPAAQPIRTIGGYPSRNGNVSQIFVNESYSFRVENKNQVLIFNDESVNVESYSSLEIDSFLDDKADKSNVLELDNLEEFTPDSDYEPTTKKYVDDADNLKADKDNVLELDNLVEFTPTELYHPTTKKYVDDEVTSLETALDNVSNLIIGVDQTWQSPSRIANTAYQNTTGKPIMVSHSMDDGDVAYVSSDGSTWIQMITSSADRGPNSYIVPNNWYYKATSNSYWLELR